MKVACFIPVKANSERVKGKNLKLLNGKPLYSYLFEHVVESDVFDDVYVDTNSVEVSNEALSKGFHVIERLPELATNIANGNDLLVHHYLTHSGYDFYFQLFVTAPYLQPKTIRECYTDLVNATDKDSIFTATESRGFYWLNGSPITYRPDVLPRSQDIMPIIEETTGLYGISAQALEKFRCRIGAKPIIKIISKFEAVDINTEEDFKMAEFIGKMIYNYNGGGHNNI